MKRRSAIPPEDLNALLDEKAAFYNRPAFIEHDPVSIPHLFSSKEDIEISGLLAATIAWGNRVSILRNAARLMEMMGHAPYEFVMNHSRADTNRLRTFVHRTFNGTDCAYFIAALKNIYERGGGLESAFLCGTDMTLKDRIVHFRRIFFSLRHPARTEKHVSDPSKKSSAKRLCMFLRWMVRRDNAGVDFGIWKNIRPADLMLPLDVHTGNVSRQLGLLTRKQNDWQAVEEVTAALRKFDPDDPVKYDFALFGMGVNKEIAKKV